MYPLRPSSPTTFQWKDVAKRSLFGTLIYGCPISVLPGFNCTHVIQDVLELNLWDLWFCMAAGFQVKWAPRSLDYTFSISNVSRSLTYTGRHTTKIQDDNPNPRVSGIVSLGYQLETAFLVISISIFRSCFVRFGQHTKNQLPGTLKQKYWFPHYFVCLLAYLFELFWDGII